MMKCWATVREKLFIKDKSIFKLVLNHEETYNNPCQSSFYFPNI